MTTTSMYNKVCFYVFHDMVSPLLHSLSQSSDEKIQNESTDESKKPFVICLDALNFWMPHTLDMIKKRNLKTLINSWEDCKVDKLQKRALFNLIQAEYFKDGCFKHYHIQHNTNFERRGDPWSYVVFRIMRSVPIDTREWLMQDLRMFEVWEQNLPLPCPGGYWVKENQVLFKNFELGPNGKPSIEVLKTVWDKWYIEQVDVDYKKYYGSIIEKKDSVALLNNQPFYRFLIEQYRPLTRDEWVSLLLNPVAYEKKLIDWQAVDIYIPGIEKEYARLVEIGGALGLDYKTFKSHMSSILNSKNLCISYDIDNKITESLLY